MEYPPCSSSKPAPQKYHTAQSINAKLTMNREQSLNKIAHDLVNNLIGEFDNVENSSTMCSWNDIQVIAYNGADVNCDDIKALVNSALKDYECEVSFLGVTKAANNLTKFGLNHGHSYYMSVRPIGTVKPIVHYR